MVNRPDRGQLALVIALVLTAWYFIGLAIGHPPDGAVLGFSAAFWTAWDEHARAKRRRRRIARRRPRKHSAVTVVADVPVDIPVDARRDDNLGDMSDERHE